MNPSTWSWLAFHLQVIGWPAVLYGVYRIIVVCFRVGRAATLIEQRVLEGEKTLYLMATNHLPHLQMELEKSNTTMQGIRDDLKLIMTKD